ncbi:uncharacterized protein BYT42DRAFT_593034 [Radiomyces spectabilis]|uniref:uncharacterized protein n=1 Tax=Radiomyces spectabilis TaxID=64574 RepID=UPI00221E54BE|nr:uncharacterized protein BYT42DRAFT_593034 [Radiomyces spectabilis]KAI8380955.1 hypothetical protein BYT42DRAFT_593034 [Radiomyces spectabilis]
MRLPKKKKLGKTLNKLLTKVSKQNAAAEKAKKRQELYEKSKKNVVGKTGTPRPKPQYSSADKILLIGEGNFSFARSLVDHYLTEGSEQLFATCYDTEAVLYEKYGDEAKDNIEAVRVMGGTVLFEVDATQLAKEKALKKHRFSKIVFNFPHAGLGIKDQDRNVLANQELLSKFFLSAEPLLSDGKTKGLEKDIDQDEEDTEQHNDDYKDPLPEGEIHVTTKTCKPYNLWSVRGLAKSTGKLAVKTTYAFHCEDFPGYEHRRTIGFKKGVSKSDNAEIVSAEPKTFVFIRKAAMDEEIEKSVKGSLKRKAEQRILNGLSP